MTSELTKGRGEEDCHGIFKREYVKKLKKLADIMYGDPNAKAS